MTSGLLYYIHMIHNHSAKIITFVGLTGSGKTAATDYVSGKGFPKVFFGGVMLDAMKAAGIEDTPVNETEFRHDLIKREGIEFVSTKITAELRALINAGQHHIVADGLSSWTEYKMLKHEFSGEMIFVAIVSPKKMRHHRLLTRPVRPLSQFEADQRDWDEIETMEKGGPIAIADHYIINDGTIDDLHEKLDKLLVEIEFID